MKIQFIAIVSIALFFVSCDKDSSDAQVMLTVQQKVTQGNKLSLSQAQIGMTEIDFELEVGGEETEFEYEGNYAFDILTGKSNPEIDMVDLEPGMYHELEFDLAPVLPSGNTIELVGTYDDYSFELNSMIEAEFEIENEDGVSAGADEENVFGLFLNLEMLFEGVDFSNATSDSDGVIRINSTSNVTVLSMIESNLENFMEFED